MSNVPQMDPRVMSLGGLKIPELTGRANAAAELAKGIAATWARRLERKKGDGSLAAVAQAIANDPSQANHVLAELVKSEVSAVIELITVSAQLWQAERLRCEGELRALVRKPDVGESS